MGFSFGKISKSNYDYLIGDEYKFTGTVVANGISYSGADIKVVVNVYQEALQRLRKESDELLAERQEYQDFADQEWQNRKRAIRELQALKPGTQERNRKAGEVAAHDSNYENAKKAADALDSQHKSKYQDLDKPPTKVLAEAQTLSISTYREKVGVRSLGSTYPKAFTRGPRQIAGSLIFTVFDRDVLYDFLEAHPSDFDSNTASSAIMDQLPPVDIIVSFANEIGSVSRMALYGVEFMSSGQVMSIEDMLTENTVNYVARDFDPMSHVGVVDLTKSNEDQFIWHSKKASDLLYEDDYEEIRSAVDPFERFRRRRNPFL